MDELIVVADSCVDSAVEVFGVPASSRPQVLVESVEGVSDEALGTAADQLPVSRFHSLPPRVAFKGLGLAVTLHPSLVHGPRLRVVIDGTCG